MVKKKAWLFSFFFLLFWGVLAYLSCYAILCHFRIPFDFTSACPTEECTGNGAMCWMNRSSIYLLLAIMINLCCLTYTLFSKLGNVGAMGTKKKNTLYALCVGFPLLLVICGYALDTDDPDVANALLNVARHGFKCSMRFASMPLEWVGIWARM
jgi:hypothetical protein